MSIKDDPIWDELLYWLKNPITAEEQETRAAEEKAYRKNILNRMFPDKEQGAVTGGAAPVDIQEHWDKNGKIYQTDGDGNRIKSTTNYLEKIGNKAKAIGSNALDMINETNSEHPSYKQKTNIIGTAAMLPYNMETALTKTVAKKLAPYTGRKIAETVGTGLNNGAIGGAVEGALRSYQEGKNPLKTIPHDAVLGAATGAGLGAAGSKIQKAVRSQVLKNIMDAKTAKEHAKEFYKDYLSGTNVNLSNSEKIQFSNSGLKKALSNSADIRKSQLIPDLPKIIKNGKIEGGLYPNKDNAKFDKYHYIKNENYKINNKLYPNRVTIGENSNGNFFYNINDINYPNALNNKNSIPLPSEQILGGTESNSIIPDNLSKLNSFQEWLEELKRKRGH